MLTCTSFWGSFFSQLLLSKMFLSAAGQMLAELQHENQQGVFWWLFLVKFLKLCLVSFSHV